MVAGIHEYGMIVDIGRAVGSTSTKSSISNPTGDFIDQVDNVEASRDGLGNWTLS